MAWDDELERLARYVQEHFGPEALTDAGRRVMVTLTAIAVEGDAADSDDVIEGADGHFYDIDEFWDAVRLELQRLVAPH